MHRRVYRFAVALAFFPTAALAQELRIDTRPAAVCEQKSTAAQAAQERYWDLSSARIRHARAGINDIRDLVALRVFQQRIEELMRTGCQVDASRFDPRLLWQIGYRGSSTSSASSTQALPPQEG